MKNGFGIESNEPMINVAEQNLAYTEIVSYLDSDESFGDVVTNILRVIGEYFRCSNVGILKIDESDRFDFFNEWTRYDKMEIFERACDDIWDYDLVYGNHMHIMSSNERGGKREYLYIKYGITALLARSIIVKGQPEMVIVMADDKPNRIWSLDDIQFISDVARMLESIITKNMSKKSLFSSQVAMREILDNVGSGLYVIDKDSKEILFANKSVENLVGKDMVGMYCCDYALCGENECKGICNHLYGDKKCWENYDSRYQKWFDIKMTDIPWVDGRIVTLCNMTNITKKKNYEKRIEVQANNDFLTGLYNRMRCESDIHLAMTKAIEEGESGYLMFLDLDDFKHINDGLGHQYGDMLLKMISISLQQIDGIANSCYRVGGDEFVILVRPEIKDKIDEIIASIYDMFNKPWLLGNTEYYSTMSMGVVCFPDDGTEVNELIKKADIAMYDAKKRGKNRIEYYNAQDEKTSIKRLDIEKNMRSAIAIGSMEFELYIQPIIDIITGQCIGGESLIRWNSSELGLLQPVDFIPLAENLGLIVMIGEYFLKKACKINKEWSNRGIEKKLHVNLSIVQIAQSNMVETISNIIRETGVHPDNITLEITESLAINDIANMKRVISEIKKLGVTIALDDFGTGYSSLSYIKQMNFDIIKVDKNFIEDLTTNDYAQTFIKLITELSKKIGAKVCIEGVEEREQLDILSGMNVDLVQGYYFGKPMPYKEFEKKFLNLDY